MKHSFALRERWGKRGLGPLYFARRGMTGLAFPLDPPLQDYNQFFSLDTGTRTWKLCRPLVQFQVQGQHASEKRR